MADQETKEIKCLLLHRLILCVFHDIRFKLTGYTPRLREVGRYFFCANLNFSLKNISVLKKKYYICSVIKNKQEERRSSIITAKES